MFKPYLNWQFFRPVIIFTILFEIVTIFFRFGLKLESTRDTASTIGVLSRGIRVHHGYTGLVIILLAMLVFKNGRKHRWLMIYGASLVLSDLVHHFLVLWPLVGSPEFDFTYQ